MAVMYNIKRRETSFHLSECFTMHLTVRLIFLIWSLSRLTQASLSDPYSSCIAGKACQAKFGNGACDQDCSSSACLRDGFDCLKDKGTCTAGYIQYCRDHYDNSHCEQGCNNAPCGWDGSDCYRSQYPIWAKGSLILHTRIPFQRGHFQNTSLLWAVSTVIQTSVKFRGMASFHLSNDLLSIDTRQLADLYAQTSSYESDGSVLFLQLDNRPCSRFPSTCFQYAVEAAHFLSTAMAQNHLLFPMIPEIKESVISVRGMDEEIGAREEVKLPKEERNASPTWMWPVVGVATGLAVAVAVIIVVLFLWLKRRRHRRDGGEHVRHRSTVTDGKNVSKAWSRRSDQQEKRGRSGRDKDILKKKKKGKDSGKRRKEPLGEDSIRMRPLRKELDIGSDTDMTQSSMEDINKTICDHRSPDHKHFQVNHHQPRMLAPPRGWERNPVPIPPRPPRNTAPVQWCGPDGSVVLIRAVRSGLDRVVLELLRAGVPVNNTDHTGRSALHWACSVNHLPLTRTLLRYGAALDLQDHKGETPLFLSALHGCYDTARFLLLNGANQELNDCKGRRPLDVAREGLHHQVLELLLAHRVQRGPVPLDPATEVLWDDRTYVYSPWVASPQCLPGRSASFSGVIGHRGMSTPPPDDWQMGRAQCASPQNWRPALNQSATALVSPRIHQSRPISTLQEVTSEAEDEERELTQEIIRAATPHFLSPQPAPRQRSFSCTQHALNRRTSGNQSELSAATLAEKAANEHVEIVIVSQPKEASQQSESKTTGTVPSSAPTEPTRENSRNYNSKIQNERINSEPSISIQTTM